MNKVLSLFIIFCLNNSVFAEAEITWVAVDWKPYFYKTDRGYDGMFYHNISLIQKGIPDLKHHWQDMNWARFWTDINTGKQVCNAMAIKTKEREKITYFSTPVTVALPFTIIMNKKTFKTLGEPVELSLFDLLNTKGISGFLEKKRSYTEIIDNYLLKHSSVINITRGVHQSDITFKMIENDRIQFTLEYSIVAQSYLGKRFDKSFVAVKIKELPDFVYSHVACAKNEWGKMVIKKINKVLKSLTRNKLYQERFRKMAVTKDEKNLFDKAYRKILSKK